MFANSSKLSHKPYTFIDKTNGELNKNYVTMFSPDKIYQIATDCIYPLQKSTGTIIYLEKDHYVVVKTYHSDSIGSFDSETIIKNFSVEGDDRMLVHKAMEEIKERFFGEIYIADKKRYDTQKRNTESYLR